MKKTFFLISMALIIAIMLTPFANAENFKFLHIAKECHDYIRENNFHYSQRVAIPLDRGTNHRVDCSSFVSWVLFRYTGGRFSESKDSSWFLGIAKSLAKNKTPQMPELTAGWQVITDLSELQPGDIMCYSGHVMIFAGYQDDTPMAYNAGDDKFIQQEINPITEKRFNQAQYGLRIP